MICNNCGNVVDVQSETKDKKRKIVVCVLIVLLVLAVLCAIAFVSFASYDKQPASKDVAKVGAFFEGEGFKTPEEAIIAYVEAFSAADVEKMLSTFAIETYVSNYDFEKDVERFTAYLPHMEQKMSAKSEYAQTLNTYIRIGHLTENIQNQYFYAVLPTDSPLANGMPVMVSDFSGGASKIDEEMSNPDYLEKLKTIKNIEIVNSEETEKAEIFMKQQSEMLQEVYGTDEIEYLCAQFEMDGEQYLICMDVFCYDGAWYNGTFNGTVGSLMGIPNNQGGIMRK